MPNDPLPPDIEAALKQFVSMHTLWVTNKWVDSLREERARAEAHLRTLLAALAQDAARWRELPNATEAK